jgi:nicotinate-nucleotide adenylyltransferase
VDTLRELGERAPEDEIVMLIGGDQAAALPAWRSPEEVMSLVSFIGVAERDEWRREEIVERLGGLCSGERVRFFAMPRVEISSTAVRRRARSGQPIRYLVPDKVANFVGAQSLYGASAPAGVSS